MMITVAIILFAATIMFVFGYFMGITTRKIFSDYHNTNEQRVDQYLKFKREEVEKEIDDYANKSKEYLDALREEKEKEMLAHYEEQLKYIERTTKEPINPFKVGE